MALSGRMFHGKVPQMATGSSVVALNESGKSGMLRIANVMSNTGNDLLTVKLEIDGVVIYNDSYQFLTLTSGYYSHGVGVPGANTNGIAQYGKVFNIPFINSVKITVNQNYQSAIDVYYSGDYVLDI